MVTGVGWANVARPHKTGRAAQPRRARGVLAFVIWLAIARLIASPGSALADSPAAEAENLIRDGVALRRQQRDVQALPLFQKAYDLVRNPRTASQLGLCELGLGYWLEAEQHLKEALATPAHPWVAKNRDTLEASLKRARDNIGQVMVTGSPAGAQVFVNGHAVGQLPLSEPLRMARGLADIELRAQGYTTAHRSITVTGEAATLAIKLEAEHPALAEAPKRVEEKLPERIQDSPEPPKSEPANPSSSGGSPPPGRTLRWAAIGTAVLGGAALAGAGIETVLWQSGVSDFNNHQTNNLKDCQVVAAQRGGPGCESLYNKFTSNERLAIIGFAVGGALAATSLTLFLVAPRSSAVAPDGVAFACVPTAIDPGVTCRLSF
jgi:hypothetical protein